MVHTTPEQRPTPPQKMKRSMQYHTQALEIVTTWSEVPKTSPMYVLKTTTKRNYREIFLTTVCLHSPVIFQVFIYTLTQRRTCCVYETQHATTTLTKACPSSRFTKTSASRDQPPSTSTTNPPSLLKLRHCRHYRRRPAALVLH